MLEIASIVVVSILISFRAVFLHIGFVCCLLYPTRRTVRTIAVCTLWSSPQSHHDLARVASKRHLITRTRRRRHRTLTFHNERVKNVMKKEQERMSVDLTTRKPTHHSKSVPTNRPAEKKKRQRENKIHMMTHSSSLTPWIPISANVVGPLAAGRCGGGACDAPPNPSVSGGRAGEAILPVR